MATFESNLTRFPNARKSGDAYTARCPAHEDRNPSLSLRKGDDGRTLLRCHAGCPTGAVAAAVGLTMSDLFPDSPIPLTTKEELKMTRNFSTATEALNAYGFGVPVSTWSYTNANGQVVGCVGRWTDSDGKKIRPVALDGAAWQMKAMESPCPLLNLPAILAAPQEPVFVVEGEKCVDAMAALGFLATTCAGGCNATDRTDWSPLARRTVFILPDNDPKGMAYASAVHGRLVQLGAVVKIVILDGLPPKGDIADLLDDAASDADRAALKQRVLDTAENTPQLSWDVLPFELAYRSFPVDQLPSTIADFVGQTARSLGCDASFVALPALTLLAAAIGNSCRLRVKADFEEPAILWTGIIGEPGTMKSPALHAAVRCGHNYESDCRKSSKAERLVVCDATTESLAEIMSQNPRGLLCVRDELAGWLGGIDRYTKSSRGGASSDRAFLLSAHDGRPHSQDRRTGSPKSLHIESNSLSLTGGIQPGVLAEAIGKADRASGLLARILFAYPPKTIAKYSDDVVDDQTKERFEAVVHSLLAFEGSDVVGISAEAKAAWVTFRDRCLEECTDLPAEFEGPWNKFGGVALRLALILHLSRSEAGDVTLDTMSRAISLTKWFQNETIRVYSMMANLSRRTKARSREDAALAYIQQHDAVRVRDLQRGPRNLREPGAAKAAVDGLRARGLVDAVRDGIGSPFKASETLQHQATGPGSQGGQSQSPFRHATTAQQLGGHQHLASHPSGATNPLLIRPAPGQRPVCAEPAPADDTD